MPITSVPNSGIDVSALRHFDREKLIYDSDLEPRERHILLAVNSFVGADGQCFPKQATIAEMTGYRRDAVNKALKGLERQNIITIKHQFRPKGQGQTSNRYFVQWGELVNRDRKTLDSRGVLSEHTYGCGVGAHPGVPGEHTINYPIEQSKELTDQKNMDKRLASQNATRPFGENSGEAKQGGKAEQQHSPGKQKDQKPHTPDSGSKEQRSAAAPRQKWTPAEGIDVDRQGWLKLPATNSAEPAHKTRLSRAKALAAEQMQYWLCEQGIREIELEEDEAGVIWVRHLNGTETAVDAFAPTGNLSLRLLRTLAYDQGLISQEEFNSTLEHFFWLSWRDLALVA